MPTIAVHKGGLILESFSLWLKFQTKSVNYFPEHYPSREKMLRTVILAIFLNNFSESEKPSEINPPLVFINIVYNVCCPDAFHNIEFVSKI